MIGVLQQHQHQQQRLLLVVDVVVSTLNHLPHHLLGVRRVWSLLPSVTGKPTDGDDDDDGLRKATKAVGP